MVSSYEHPLKGFERMAYQGDTMVITRIILISGVDFEAMVRKTQTTQIQISQRQTWLKESLR